VSRGTAPRIRLGVTIMHHPRRRDRIPALLQACAPLHARVVTDPDPAGVPSPLRTAKRAWAQIPDGVTHHLVLQDDIRLVRNFADRLVAAIAQRPDHGISLYSHWDSPQNSYLVRRATIAGSPWVPLSRHEWTPTQGFVLPAAHARRLAEYLAGIPDEVKDDDEMVVIFCRERSIPVVATVPHLVDHRADETIVGHPGTFHATVFVDDPWLAPGHWAAAPATGRALAGRCRPEERRAYAVELRRSRCLVRFFRPGTAEPVEHRFGWYWHDWAAAVGLDVARTLDDCAAFLGDAGPASAIGRLPAALVTEVWAAGYLLGADAAAVGDEAADHRLPERARAALSRAAIASWVRSGLAPVDRARLGPAAERALVDVGLAGVVSGWAGRGMPVRPGQLPARSGLPRAGSAGHAVS
jgi:hypothetical protein